MYVLCVLFRCAHDYTSLWCIFDGVGVFVLLCVVLLVVVANWFIVIVVVMCWGVLIIMCDTCVV